MADLLYLDTARLGRMSPAARQAQNDFGVLAGEEGCSAYFEQFVRHGFAACPAGMGDRYPGLRKWQGVAEFKRSLRVLVGHRPDLPVLLTHRSAQLMKLAARLLFHTCRNVLITDLGWPGYHGILEQEAARARRGITTVVVRNEILTGQLGEAELVDRICGAFAHRQCDGVFLTAVSNWGAQLPVERIVRRLEAAHRVRFVVVDGAQDFCHTPGRLEAEYCDLYLAGCHKWLSAYHPVGLGFYGRRRSRGVIDTVVSHMMETGDLDDPLLRFSGQLEAGGLDRVTETLHMLPLFSARGAVTDAETGHNFSYRAENGQTTAILARTAGWRPLVPEAPLRSGILLLEAERAATRSACPNQLRTSLRDAGVAATTYTGGLVRLSMPAVALTAGELDCLAHALRLTA